MSEANIVDVTIDIELLNELDAAALLKNVHLEQQLVFFLLLLGGKLLGGQRLLVLR